VQQLRLHAEWLIVSVLQWYQQTAHYMEQVRQL
jgi:hypothetical protein